MEKEALKKLIEKAYDNCENISDFKGDVLDLIDLHHNEKQITVNINSLISTTASVTDEDSEKAVQTMLESLNKVLATA